MIESIGRELGAVDSFEQIQWDVGAIRLLMRFSRYAAGCPDRFAP